MRYHVAHDLKRPVGTSLHYRIREESLQLEDLLLGQVEGSLELMRTRRGLLARLEATAIGHGQCARCLQEAVYNLEIQFEEEFLPLVDVFTGVPLPPPEDGDIFTIGPDFVLDLREALRQYAILAQPINPLCRPDCRGLCQKCGQDLNEGSCLCSWEVDSRWAPLKALAAELKEE